MHGACILYLPPNLPTTSISAILFRVVHPCAQIPLDYAEGYDPKLAQ